MKMSSEVEQSINCQDVTKEKHMEENGKNAKPTLKAKQNDDDNGDHMTIEELKKKIVF